MADNAAYGVPAIQNRVQLYAIDIYHRMIEPLTIAWFFGCDKFRPEKIKSDKTLRYIPKYQSGKILENLVEDESMEPSLLYDTETATVFISLPTNSTFDSIKGEGQSTFWGIKDAGNNAELVFKKYLSISAMEKYEASNVKLELNFHSNDGNPGKEVKVSKGYLWVAETNAVLSTKWVKVTSKIIVACRSDNSLNLLIFGIKVPKVMHEFREVSTSFREINLSFSNFVVAYDTSMSEERLLWKISTPDNTAVNGQIVGIPRSTAARKILTERGNIDPQDLHVAFSQTGQRSTYFALH
ncbi:hypothetical protein CHS0354_006113 [Potamilus streckersoni]|uniref:Uncharacterized protein n=1 Tax=Potamilus streckersoni TaxID=2493646 RepID=A0AAE0STA1_9BIVA|nr:hypothetical protein CHS0354_006113 [Potamilus streckersoni]